MNCYPCVICGMARYSHDVVLAPKLKSGYRMDLWKQQVGETAFGRMLDHAQDAFVCVEHYDYEKSFDEFGKIKRRARPEKIDEKETDFYEAYFHDHGLFDLYRSDFNRKSKPVFHQVSCSLCSCAVEKEDMESHAILHAPIDISEHQCEKHKTNDLLSNTADCLECSYNQSKAAFDLAKIRAEQCFPMFEFIVTNRQIDEEVVFSLESRIAEEYINIRPGLIKGENIASTSDNQHELGEPLEKKIKLEPVDEEEQAVCKQEEPDDYPVNQESISSEVEVKNECVDSEVEIKTECMENEEEEEKQPMQDMMFEKGNDPHEEVDMMVASCSKNTDPQRGTQNIHSTSDMTHEELEVYLEMFYQTKKHPTFEELNTLRELVCNYSTFRHIFSFFEKKRGEEGEECAENDTCVRARRYLEMEGKPVGPVVENSQMTEKMNELFENYTNREMNNGYSYQISDILGLPPKYVRHRYVQFLNRKHFQRKEEVRIKRKHESDDSRITKNGQKISNALTPEAEKILEETYIKRQSVIRKIRWGRAVIESLSTWCGVSTYSVQRWIKERTAKDSKKNKLTSSSPTYVWRDWQISVLKSSFLRNNYPSADEFEKLAETFKVKVTNVIQWFTTKQTISQRFIALPRETEQLTELSKKDRGFLKEFVEIHGVVSGTQKKILAVKFDIPIEMLTRWIEICKSELTAEKRSKFSPDEYGDVKIEPIEDSIA